MKRAFTLAEILITLGIIGVVASLTIPTLVNNYRKKQFQSNLKKEYSVLLQALEMYKKDNGEYLKTSDCYGKHACLKRNIQPYLKVLFDCGDYQSGNSSQNCAFNGYYSGKYTYKTYSGLQANENKLDDGQLILNDGAQLLFEGNGYTTRFYVSVDINGYKKLPNKWGEDLFTFQLMESGKLLPMGAPETDFSYTNDSLLCSRTSQNDINGIACANRAIYDNSFWNE